MTVIQLTTGHVWFAWHFPMALLGFSWAFAGPDGKCQRTWELLEPFGGAGALKLEPFELIPMFPMFAMVLVYVSAQFPRKFVDFLKSMPEEDA